MLEYLFIPHSLYVPAGGMGNSYSLPRTPEDFLSNVDEMDSQECKLSLSQWPIYLSRWRQIKLLYTKYISVSQSPFLWVIYVHLLTDNPLALTQHPDSAGSYKYVHILVSLRNTSFKFLVARIPNTLARR